jgi:hypothetical protein
MAKRIHHTSTYTRTWTLQQGAEGDEALRARQQSVIAARRKYRRIREELEKVGGWVGWVMYIKIKGREREQGIRIDMCV